MIRSKYENTVIAALRRGWTIEQIQHELPRITDPMTIHNIAKRHGLKARHATRHENRKRRVAVLAKRFGVGYAAAELGLSENTVREYFRDHVRSCRDE